MDDTRQYAIRNELIHTDDFPFDSAEQLIEPEEETMKLYRLINHSFWLTQWS